MLPRLLALLLLASPVLAQPRTPAAPAMKLGAIPAADAPGARDAAVLPRYAGAILLEAKAVAFDGAALPNAKLVRRGDDRDRRNNAVFAPPQPLAAEGRVTRLTYLQPEGRSALEVARGYQQYVTDAGGAKLWECRGEECGGSPVTRLTAGGSETGIIHLLYPADSVSGPWTGCPFDEARTDQRYTLFDLPKGAGKAAVLAWTVGEVSAGSECHAWVRRLVTLVVVVETAAREQRMETVNAAALGQGLASQGRVALYSILFDTGRAEVKPESQPQLAEVSAYLKAAPTVRALVVGHTDNQGALDYNQDLSRRRAQAVVAALVSQGITAARLTALGVGMASPLATNDSDEGRAKNRRVELVKQ